MPLLTKETPPGRAPNSDIVVAVGLALVVTVKELAVPTMKVVLLTLMILGGVPSTCIEVVEIALSTVAVTEPVPGVPPAVKVEVADPPLRVPLVGLSEPSEEGETPKLTGVPVGTEKPDALAELVLMLAVKVDVFPGLTEPEDALRVSTR